MLPFNPLSSLPGIASDTSLQNQFTTTTPLPATYEDDDDEALYWSGLDKTSYVNANLVSVSPPAVIIPPRYFEQPPSASGMRAYTLFGGPDQGVFYNWYKLFPPSLSLFIFEGLL
jgi:hypothetical protein